MVGFVSGGRRQHSPAARVQSQLLLLVFTLAVLLAAAAQAKIAQGNVLHTSAAVKTKGNPQRFSVMPVRRTLVEGDTAAATGGDLCNSQEPTAFTSVSELIKYAYWSRSCSSQPREFGLAGQSFTFRAYQVWPFVEETGGGISIDLLKDVAEAAGFSYIVVGPNTTVPGRLGALQDVSLGVADATVGPITISTTKQPLQFTTPYMDTGLVLVTLKPMGDDTLQASDLYAWMLPFTWSVWGVILTLIFVFGGLMFLLEQDKSEDFSSLEEKGGRGWWKSTYLSSMMFIGQVAGHFPGGGMGRVFMQSSAFVAVILASSYTANLATFLTEAKSGGDVALSSIHEAQLLASQICVINGTTAQGVLTSSYNRIQQIPIIQNTTERAIEDGMNRLRDYECEGFIMDELVARSTTAAVNDAGEGIFCDLQISGTVFVKQSYAVAVRKVGKGSPDYARLQGLYNALNYYFTKMRVEGNLTRLYVDNFVLESPCPSSSSDDERIGARQVLGPLVVFYGIAVVALVGKLFQMYTRRSCAKP